MYWKTVIPGTVGACAALLALAAQPAIAADSVVPATDCPFTDEMKEGIKADWTPVLPDEAFKTNCGFHQWSWMMFLWLTDDVDGQLRFETMPTSQEVINGDQLAVDVSETLAPRMEKSNKMNVIAPILLDDVPGNPPLEEIYQAGSAGLLVDQKGRAVYYSMNVSPEFFAFAVTDNHLEVPENLLNFPATNDFPMNAMEIKASWKIVEEGEDVSGLYTRQAQVTKLKNNPDGPGVVPDLGNTAEETVALVGLHIAGVVQGHPEMIWATFEYNRNAPVFAPDQAMDAPVSPDDYLFYKGGTPAVDCNINNAQTLKVVDADTQVLAPITQACLQFAYGGGTETNKANIQALNTEAPGVVESLGLNPVFANYLEIGAIWFKTPDALEPDDPIDTDALLAGSFVLSNSTIETFTQKIASENNCFKCHNTAGHYAAGYTPLPGKNVNISRILTNAYFINQKKK